MLGMEQLIFYIATADKTTRAFMLPSYIASKSLCHPFHMVKEKNNNSPHSHDNNSGSGP